MSDAMIARGSERSSSANVHNLLRHHHGTDLKKSQSRPGWLISTFLNGHCEFNLDVGAEFVLRRFEQRFDQMVDRELLQHQQGSEVEDARTTRAQTGYHAIASRVKGRSQKAEHIIGLGLLQARCHQVLSLADRIVRRRLAHVDRPEFRLRTAEQFLHRAKRGWLFRVSG